MKHGSTFIRFLKNRGNRAKHYQIPDESGSKEQEVLSKKKRKQGFSRHRPIIVSHGHFNALVHHTTIVGGFHKLIEHKNDQPIL